MSGEMQFLPFLQFTGTVVMSFCILLWLPFHHLYFMVLYGGGLDLVRIHRVTVGFRRVIYTKGIGLT
jgi:hypothetical protein